MGADDTTFGINWTIPLDFGGGNITGYQILQVISVHAVLRV